MFDALSEKLQATLGDVRQRGTLTEDDINAAMREIRLALLEADVNFKVVKQFTGAVKERALGSDVVGALNPGQQVVKIVNEELSALMGGAANAVVVLAAPADGDPDGRPPGLGQDDRHGEARALAERRARLVGRRRGLRRAPPGRGRAARQGRRPGRRHRLRAAGPTRRRSRSPPGRWSGPPHDGKDVLIVDTAGRLHVDAALMDELKEIRKAVKPHNVLLVVDAMTGQDAVNVALAVRRRRRVRRRRDEQARRRRPRRRRAQRQAGHRQADPVRLDGREARPVRALPPRPHGPADPRDGRRAVVHRARRGAVRGRRGRRAREEDAQGRVHARGLPQAAEDDPRAWARCRTCSGCSRASPASRPRASRSTRRRWTGSRRSSCR